MEQSVLNPIKLAACVKLVHLFNLKKKLSLLFAKASVFHVLIQDIEHFHEMSQNVLEIPISTNWIIEALKSLYDKDFLTSNTRIFIQIHKSWIRNNSINGLNLFE